MTHRLNRRLALAVTLLATLATLAGCGGGNERDRTKAQLRLVNASAYAGLTLNVDNSPLQAGVPYGGTEAYADVSPSRRDSTLTASGSATALLSFTPDVGRDRRYTLLAYGREGQLRQLLLEDSGLASPPAGRSALRVVNAAPDAGPLDIYLTAPGDSLAAALPLRANVAVDEATPPVDTTPASWRLRVTAAGSKTDLRLDLPVLSLRERQIDTLVLSAARGGVLVNALLLTQPDTQRGSIVRADSTQARVRVAAGAGAGGTVSAQVGTVTLLGGVGSPAVSLYTLVPAGTQTVAVAVDGQPIALPAVNLPAGADLTLMVHGSSAAPRADWLDDDNRAPPDAGTARVRLAHGVAGLPGTLSLTADFLPLADNVPLGQASAYGALTGRSTSRVAVTAAGLAQPLFVAPEQALLSGGVYTVFVVGEAGAPVGIVRQDR